MSYEREVNAAKGFLELGMLEDALAELSMDARSTLEGHRLMIEIYLHQKDWGAADNEARSAIRKFPKHGDLYVSGAYARRRKESVAAARLFLLEGSPWLSGEPVFHFNLACYEMQLGNEEKAISCLEQALELNPKWIELARQEMDLKPLADQFNLIAERVHKRLSGATSDFIKWKKLLELGNIDERKIALDSLVAHRAEKVLADLLSHPDPVVMEFAMHGLWECWLNEKGVGAFEQIQDGIRLMNNGDMDAAEKHFYFLVREYAGWSEALNKLATVLALQGRYRDSIDLCRQVLAAKPYHFGCWSGLLLCAQKIEDWETAYIAVSKLVELLPHNDSYRKTMKLIEALRNK